MERRKFFSVLGVGAAVIVLERAIPGCTKDNSSPSAPSNVDFTLDLNNSAYSSLKNAGGSVHNNHIVIAHTTSNEYIALSDICTHQACTVDFNGNSGFVCPCHGSTYSKDGAVTGGPAPSALRKYNTTLTGTSLRVFS